MTLKDAEVEFRVAPLFFFEQHGEKKPCISEQHFPPPAPIEAVINTPNGSKLHTKVTTKTKDEDFSISWFDLLHSGCTDCVGRFACNTNKQKKALL